MKTVITYIFVLLSTPWIFAQNNREYRYISLGVTTRLTDFHVPNELHLTVMTKDFNPFTITLSRAQFTYNTETAGSVPRMTNGTDVSLTETVNGFTGKFGYTVFHSITPKTIKYAAANFAITDYNHQLNLFYTDPIYGKWKESYTVNQHNIGIELAYYIGRRFLDDLFCINLNGCFGVKTMNESGFEKYVTKYPAMDKFYTPGFGYGINSFYFNISVGLAISI